MKRKLLVLSLFGFLLVGHPISGKALEINEKLSIEANLTGVYQWLEKKRGNLGVLPFLSCGARLSCMAYAVTVRAESGSLRFVLQIMETTLTTAYIISFIVYQLTKLFFSES